MHKRAEGVRVGLGGCLGKGNECMRRGKGERQGHKRRLGRA